MTNINSTQIFQLIALFIALLEITLSLYILALNYWNPANRLVSILLFVVSVNSFGLGLLFAADNVSQATLPTVLLAITTPMFLPGLLIIGIFLLKPAWMRGKWRYFWWFIYTLALLPAVLLVLDSSLDTRLWYTNLNPDIYSGGFANLAEYTGGILSPYIRIVNIYIIPTITIIPLAFIAYKDKSGSKSNRRLAKLLLICQILGVISSLALNVIFITPISVIVGSSIFVVGFAYAGFQQMISERGLQRGSIRSRLTALILAITIPILLGVTFYVSNLAGDQIQKDASERLAITGQLLARNTKIWLESNIMALDELVSLPSIISMDSEQQEPVLQAMADSYTYMHLVSTTDMNGLNISRSDSAEPEDYSDSGWFKEARSGNQINIQTVIDDTSSVPSLVVSMPIRSNSKDIIGVGMISVDLVSLAKIIKINGSEGHQTAYIVDSNNQVIFHSDQTSPSELRNLSNEAAIRALRSGIRGETIIIDGQEEQWRVYVDELPYGWGVVTQVKEADFVGTALLFQRVSWIVIGLSAILLISLASLTVRQVTYPIGTLTETAIAIEAGDLTRLAPVESNDEFGILAKTFNRMTERLLELIGGLEQRIAERTKELERRTLLIQAATDVSSAATSVLNVDQLINEIVEVIRERFNLYYVGLFLVDDTSEWAILKAGTGTAGNTMLSRGHRIKVGEGMIGWSVANAKARVSHEADEDTIRLATAELPETRSEAAVPLRSRGEVIGALTIQDRISGAFDEEFILIIQTMADQIAVMIDNTRLYASSQEALESARKAYQLLSRDAWLERLRSQHEIIYRSDEKGISIVESNLLSEPEKTEEDSTAKVDNLIKDNGHRIAFPIKARGTVIGSVDTYKPDDSGDWSQGELTLIEAIVDQLGVALDSARLYEEIQQSAESERVISEISSRVRETLDIESVLKTAAKEMRDILDLDEVEVRIGSDDNLPILQGKDL